MFESLDYSIIADQITKFIRNFVIDKSVVMGLSGGIDSSVSCKLAVDALGSDKVKVIIVLNNQFSKEGIEIATQFAQGLGVEIKFVDSDGFRDSILSNLVINNADLILQATIDVRICDLIIRTIAQIEDRLYMGTINGTERMVGWFPKGALIGDFDPIGDLCKQQLIGLARYLKLDELSEGVSDDVSIICGGCGELPEFKGIPYSTLDEILYNFETTGFIGSSDIEKVVLTRINFVKHKRLGFSLYPKINTEKR